ncbi:hypothetical protein C0992_003406, partial [Termitomyces sp. T32_za158]
MTEEEFQGTLEREDELDQPKMAGKKVVKQPDKAYQLNNTCAKQVARELSECQPTSSRVKVEDLVTDKVEYQQLTAASM